MFDAKIDVKGLVDEAFSDENLAKLKAAAFDVLQLFARSNVIAVGATIDPEKKALVVSIQFRPKVMGDIQK